MRNCLIQAEQELHLVVALALSTILCLLAWSAPAAAGTLTIQYQITSGTLNGSPLPSPGGTYTIRVAATGPGTVVSGPATLLTLNPSSGLVPALTLEGTPGNALPSTSTPPYTFRGAVSRTQIGGPGISTYTVFYTPYSPGTFSYWGSLYSTAASAKWHGLLGPGSAGRLDVFSSYFISAGLGPWITISSRSDAGSYVGAEIDATYVPEPAISPLVASALMTLAGVFIARSRLRRS